ncbi:MAG: hypothetical protein Q7R93_01600 [bacterium]|nr:hypothetical protein [bacterium]
MKILKTVRVVLSSTAPTLINAMLAAKVDEIGGVTASQQQRKDRPDHEVATAKLYRHPITNVMGWPGINLGATLCEGGKHIKMKLGSATKASALTSSGGASKVPTLIFLKDFYPFDGLDDNGEIIWMPNVAPTRNPQTGGRNRTVRPLIPNWKCTVQHGFWGDQIVDHTMLSLWQFAGEKAGLGDGRPSAPDKPLPIPHGTFEVIEFEVTNVRAIVDRLVIGYSVEAAAAMEQIAKLSSSAAKAIGNGEEKKGKGKGKTSGDETASPIEGATPSVASNGSADGTELAPTNRLAALEPATPPAASVEEVDPTLRPMGDLVKDHAAALGTTANQ